MNEGIFERVYNIILILVIVYFVLVCMRSSFSLESLSKPSAKLCFLIRKTF